MYACPCVLFGPSLAFPTKTPHSMELNLCPGQTICALQICLNALPARPLVLVAFTSANKFVGTRSWPKYLSSPDPWALLGWPLKINAARRTHKLWQQEAPQVKTNSK